MKLEKISRKQFIRDFKRSITPIGLSANDAYMNIRIPERSTERSCGFDFKMPYDLHVMKNVPYKIPTGIKVDLSSRLPWRLYSLDIYPRSSMGMKYGMKCTNTVGIIDADYYNNADNEGHIFIEIEAEKDIDLKCGDRFAQGIIHRCYTVGDKPKGKRNGGMGSTGR